MKITGKKTLLLAALVAVLGTAVATPARADWYDGHHWHHGHVWRNYHWDPYRHYYVYGPSAVVVAPPTGIVVAQPAPPPVIVTQPVYTQPQVVYAQPQPVYIAPQPAPVSFGLGVHIR